MNKTACAFTLLTLLGPMPAGASKRHFEDHKMYLFDAAYLHDEKIPNDRYWDEMHLIASIQGIANREAPRLYILFVGDRNGRIDRQWLDYLREDDGWLRGWEVVEVKGIENLIRTFRREIKGAVVYDPGVPATSNVASTAAGVEDLVCVRYDPSKESLYWRLVEDPGGPRLPVVLRLLTPDNRSLFTGRGTIPDSKTSSTGSAKCDAYIWAKERYLDTGKCDPTKIGYYIDYFWTTKGGERTLATLTNHDYFISCRGFFCDLSPWDDEKPIDDPEQPLGADLKTLKEILNSAYKQMNGRRMIHVGGFTPWAFKYTVHAGGSHEGVPTEWQTSQIITCFNAYLDADAIGLSGMANASFFRHYPLEPEYSQKLPSLDDLKAKGYMTSDGRVVDRKFVTIYVGDYDSAAWLYQRIWDYWQDPARGTIPLGWAFNPNLADRFPVGMAMTRKKKSELDYFVAGDSGAGYINPGHLLEPRPFSGLPSAMEVWTEHCKRYYRQWDIRVTGFIIDGYARSIGDEGKAAYADFSPRGIVAQKIEQQGIFAGMPFVRMDRDLDGPPEAAARRVLGRIKETGSQFMIFRTILWTPSAHAELFKLIKSSPEGSSIEIVDPYTFFLLLKTKEEGR